MRAYEGLVLAGEKEVGHVRRLNLNVDKKRRQEIRARKWGNDRPGLLDTFLADESGKVPEARLTWAKEVVERAKNSDRSGGPYKLIKKLNSTARK